MRIMFLGILLLGCCRLLGEFVRDDARSLVFRQPDQREVVLPKNPQRVVVGYGSLAKVWDLAGGSAVGVPGLVEKSALPERMRELPAIGSATTPNLEKVMLQNPDLVLLVSKLERHRTMAELLRQSGIAAVCVEYNNYGDFHQLLELFCRLNGKTLDAVPAAVRVTREVEGLCAGVRGLRAPRCAVIFAASSGFSLESHRTNTGMMVEMLGGENIMKEQGFARRGFSYEQLLLDNPEVILVVTMGDAKALQEKFRREFCSQPAWQELAAAKVGRVHFLPVEMFLYMPGPDYPAAFRYLAGLLYPARKEMR